MSEKKIIAEIPTSSRATAIKMVLESRSKELAAVYGEKMARDMLDELAPAFEACAEDYTPIQKANGRYVAKIPKSIADLNRCFCNLKLHGKVFIPPVAKPSDSQPEKGTA